jgi:hypothetical protein
MEVGAIGVAGAIVVLLSVEVLGPKPVLALAPIQAHQTEERTVPDLLLNLKAVALPLVPVRMELLITPIAPLQTINA